MVMMMMMMKTLPIRGQHASLQKGVNVQYLGVVKNTDKRFDAPDLQDYASQAQGKG